MTASAPAGAGPVNAANALTALRLAMIPVFLALLAGGERSLAFWVFILASVTDFLDGLAARLLSVRTPLGAVLDVVADKLLLSAAFCALPFVPTGMDPALVGACSAAVLIRHVVLTVLWMAGRRARVASVQPPTWMGKSSTLLQMVAVPGTLLPLPAAILVPVWTATLFTTFYSAGEYLWNGFARVRAARREALLGAATQAPSRPSS